MRNIFNRFKTICFRWRGDSKSLNLNDIEVDSATKRFQDTVAVDNVSMKIARGELFGLLGPNGAGKSTLTKMLCGMINPTSGTIKVGGRNIRDDPPESERITRRRSSRHCSVRLHERSRKPRLFRKTLRIIRKQT